MRHTHERRGNRRFPQFTDWLEEKVRDLATAGEILSEDLVAISRLPSPVVKRYNSMSAYGFHFRADDEQGRSHKSFDAGVAAIITQTCRSSRSDRNPVEAALQYVGIINEILKIEYGHISFNVLNCSWIKPHLEGIPTMRVDEDGFWSVKFNARQTPPVEPYIFPKDAKQVRFSHNVSWYMFLCDIVAFTDSLIMTNGTIAR